MISEQFPSPGAGRGRNCLGKRAFAGSHHLSWRSHTATSARFSSAPGVTLESPGGVERVGTAAGSGEGAVPYSPCARAALVCPGPLALLSRPHRPGGGTSLLTSTLQHGLVTPCALLTPPCTHLSPGVSQRAPSTLGEAAHMSGARPPGSPTDRDRAHPTRLHPCSMLLVPWHPSCPQHLSGHTHCHPGRGEKSQSGLL